MARRYAKVSKEDIVAINAAFFYPSDLVNTPPQGRWRAVDIYPPLFTTLRGIVVYYPLPPREIGMWRCWFFDEIEKERGASRQRTQPTLTGLHPRDTRCLEWLCREKHSLSCRLCIEIIIVLEFNNRKTKTETAEWANVWVRTRAAIPLHCRFRNMQSFWKN